MPMNYKYHIYIDIFALGHENDTAVRDAAVRTSSPRVRARVYVCVRERKRCRSWQRREDHAPSSFSPS